MRRDHDGRSLLTRALCNAALALPSGKAEFVAHVEGASVGWASGQ